MEQRWLTGGTVGAIGLLLASIQITHATRQTDLPIAIVVDAVPFVAMGLGVAFTGFWLARDPAFDDQAVRVGLWSVGGMIAMVSVAALVLFGQRVATGTLDRAIYLTLDLITVGALGGALVGLYDARSQRRRVDLAAERDRIGTFASKAADVNNFGRAIYGARNLDGVAAYVVQAVETLVGLRETAVVRVDDDTVEPIANTMRTVDLERVGELARDARTHTPREVVLVEEHPNPVPTEIATIVTALIHEGPEGAIVVVGLSAGDDPVREEDRQLLELVVAHAAATIRQFEAEGNRIA